MFLNLVAKINQGCFGVHWETPPAATQIQFFSLFARISPPVHVFKSENDFRCIELHVRLVKHAML